MPCQFIIKNESNQDIKICIICGKEINSKFPPEKIFARCVGDKKPEMPNIAIQATNLLTTLADFTKSGFETVSEKEYNERIEICKNCDKFTDNRCSLCGCNMHTKARMKIGYCPLKTEEFPNGKWPVIE